MLFSFSSFACIWRFARAPKGKRERDSVLLSLLKKGWERWGRHVKKRIPNHHLRSGKEEPKRSFCLSQFFFKKIRPFSADGVKYHVCVRERRSEKNQALIIAPNFLCAIREVLFIWGICCMESMIIWTASERPFVNNWNVTSIPLFQMRLFVYFLFLFFSLPSVKTRQVSNDFFREGHISYLACTGAAAAAE